MTQAHVTRSCKILETAVTSSQAPCSCSVQSSWPGPRPVEAVQLCHHQTYLSMGVRGNMDKSQDGVGEGRSFNIGRKLVRSKSVRCPGRCSGTKCQLFCDIFSFFLFFYSTYFSDRMGFPRVQIICTEFKSQQKKDLG